MCVVEGMKYRVGEAVEQNIPPPRRLRIRPHDAGIVLVLAVALAFSFTRVARRRRLRRTFQVAVIAYLGFYLGEMIALPLLAGWSQSGVPWHAVPGITLLVAAAFLIPFVTRRPTYCAQICPHGAAQEILGRVSRRKWRVPPGLRDGLRWLPWLLLAFAVVVVMLLLPIDLASLEPFDAYVFRLAGWATISIAVAGLIASIFTAQAYCKYGCPTGALLEAVRSHGRADRFSRRDVALGVLLILAAVVHWQYPLIYGWIVGF
jgi:polyferredoxin